MSDNITYVYSVGFHSIGEYDKYLRYIENPRKRQFGVKSGVFQTERRSPSSATPAGEVSTSKTENVPSSTGSHPEGRNTDEQLSKTERPMTSRKLGSARRSKTRRPKPAINRKTVESETSSDRSQRKQSAPLVRPKTGRGRTDKSPTTQRENSGGVKGETRAPRLRFLAMATDGVFSESSSGSKPASIGEGADTTSKPNREEHTVGANGVPSAEALQSTSSQSKEDVNKTGYRILPLNTQQEIRKHSGEQAITVEDVGTKNERTTSKGQIGDQTSKDNVIVVRDLARNDEDLQRKGVEFGLSARDYDSEHTQTQTIMHKSPEAGRIDDDDAKEGVRHDDGSVTSNRRTDDNPTQTTLENGKEVTENDGAKTKETETIQRVATSFSEKGQLTNTEIVNVDDTSGERGTVAKNGDVAVTGYTFTSFEEQRGGATSDSGRTTGVGVTPDAGPRETISPKADDRAEREERSWSSSTSDKDGTASDTNAGEVVTDEDDQTKQDPENETTVKVDADNHLDITLSTATDSDETSYFASDSETENDHSAASSRHSATQTVLTAADVEAGDDGPRGDGEPRQMEAVVTSTGLTAADLARLQAAEDELFGTSSSGDNQSYESSDSSSLTGRYSHNTGST